MALPTLTLKPLRPERAHHPWVYDNEIARPPGAGFADGGLVRIVDTKGRTLGIGYANLQSKIAARFLTRRADVTVDAAFWRRRIQQALAYRQARYGAEPLLKEPLPVSPSLADPPPAGEGAGTACLKPSPVRGRVASLSEPGGVPKGPGGVPAGAGFLRPLPPAYRLAHGEADGLPGLVVDVYPGYGVVQFLARGLEPWREVLISALTHALPNLRGLYERSDSPVRRLEGLPEQSGALWGEPPPDVLEWEDNGAVILADLKTGAKTGLFLDQRENQQAAANEARGRDVLNCFAYTGLFGLRAALAGAKSVTDVETSPAFNALNAQQWARNGLTIPHAVVAENVFDYLHALADKKYATDMVILDPPAFTKSRANRDGAMRGYNEINRLALRLLRPGGVLVTCSCSHHLSAGEFREIVQGAARDAGRSLKLVARRGQPPDHPVLLDAPETEYLKCLLLAAE